jgi:hypothetical protein
MRTSTTSAVTTWLAAAALWLIGAGSASGQADFSSFSIPLPSFQADTFTLIFQGDQTSQLAGQVAGDANTDPFALAGGTPKITATFNSGSNTTDLVFMGSPIGPGTAVTTGPVTFGVNDGTQPSVGIHLDGAFWSSSMSANQQAVPVGGITVFTPPPPPPPPVPYIVITVETENGVWEYTQNPITGELNQIQIGIENDTSSSDTILNAGYFISPTQIPLDDLNLAMLPPPGSAGSQFIPLPSLDGTTLPPGTMVGVTVPEPASALALGQGLLGLAALAWYRRRRTSAAR